MKKVIVILAILAAAAACGGATAGSTSGQPVSRPVAGQPGPTTDGNPPVKYDPSTGEQGNPVPNVVPTVQGPQVIRTAQLTITVGSGLFDTKLANVRALVQLQGGFISGTDAQANPVQNEHISGNDVSAQYVDLQARLANQEAQRNAMLALLRRAQSISDIIAVQNQIGQITGQIEQLKGQISYIEHNTTYSTVTVSLLEAGAPLQTTTRDNWGFATAMSDAAHNFVTTINYVITGLGAIGPIVILLWLGYLLWQRSGRPGWPVAPHA